MPRGSGCPFLGKALVTGYEMTFAAEPKPTKVTRLYAKRHKIDCVTIFKTILILRMKSSFTNQH